MALNFIDLAGERFGRLVVLHRVANNTHGNEGGSMSLNRCYNRLCDQKPTGQSVYCARCEREKQQAVEQRRGTDGKV